MFFEGPIQDLIDQLGRLPGIGPKSAQRIAFYILQNPGFDVSGLARVLLEVRQRVRFCSVCFSLSDRAVCAICADESRQNKTLCVVEEPKDVVAIEKTRRFRGRYHVLGGSLSPINGIGPDQLRIRELLDRLIPGVIEEVILACDPNLEGDATVTYLFRLLAPLGLRVSKLASGLPVGGDLEYADELTLARALSGRLVLADEVVE